MGVNEIDFAGLNASNSLQSGLQLGSALGQRYRNNRLQDSELQRRDQLEAEAKEKQKQQQALERMYRDALYIKSLPSYEAKQAHLKSRIASGGVTGDMSDSQALVGMQPEAFDREIDYVINKLAPLESLMKDGGYTLKDGDIRFDQNNKPVAQNTNNKSDFGLNEMKGLNKDLTGFIKPAQSVRLAASELDKLKKVDSASSKMAAVFKFMKALDPTSAVRETEQGQVYSAGGLASELAGKLNSLKGEGGLEDEVFTDLVFTAKELANTNIESVTGEINSYLDSYADMIAPDVRSRLASRIPKSFNLPKPPPDAVRNPDGTFTLSDGTIIRRKVQ